MKKLQIDEANARKLYPTASKEWKTTLEDTFGKEFFSQKITNRMKTWEDICDELDIDPINSLPFKKAKDKTEKYLNACFKISKISEVLNEGEKLDFNNSSTYKYYPYFQRKGSVWLVDSCSYYDFFTDLCFGSYYKNYELALYAGNQFLDIYSDYLPE
jgi:hypothetical protein